MPCQTAGYMPWKDQTLMMICPVPFSLDHTVHPMAFTPVFQTVMHKLSIASENNDCIFILMVLDYIIFQNQHSNQ